MNKNKLIGAFTALAAAALTTGTAVLTAFAEEAESSSSADTAATSTSSAFFQLILPLAIMFGLLYFIAIRPQKKRDKELKEMQESLQVGDEIVTGGGIVGIVVSTGEDTVVIETGGARHKLRIKNWAITENVTAQERMKEAKAAAKAPSGLESAAVVDDDEKKPKKKKKDE